MTAADGYLLQADGTPEEFEISDSEALWACVGSGDAGVVSVLVTGA